MCCRQRNDLGFDLCRPGYKFRLYQVLAESQLPYLKNRGDDSYLKRLHLLESGTFRLPHGS